MCWHKWGKWEVYTWDGLEKIVWQTEWNKVSETRQKRSCLKCGYTQDELIKRG